MPALAGAPWASVSSLVALFVLLLLWAVVRQHPVSSAMSRLRLAPPRFAALPADDARAVAQELGDAYAKLLSDRGEP